MSQSTDFPTASRARVRGLRHARAAVEKSAAPQTQKSGHSRKGIENKPNAACHKARDKYTNRPESHQGGNAPLEKHE
jgi:hypothetical protein